MAVALRAAGAVTYLHADPIVWTLRLYDEPDGYEQRMPYRAVATVSIMGAQAWIGGLHGRFDRAAWREVHRWLRARGVSSVAMERRGRLVTLSIDGATACDAGAGAPISERVRG